jgi:hypothetical protein
MQTLEETPTIASQQNDLQRANAKLQHLNMERGRKQYDPAKKEKLDTQIQTVKNVISLLEFRGQ